MLDHMVFLALATKQNGEIMQKILYSAIFAVLCYA